MFVCYGWVIFPVILTSKADISLSRVTLCNFPAPQPPVFFIADQQLQKTKSIFIFNTLGCHGLNPAPHSRALTPAPPEWWRGTNDTQHLAYHRCRAEPLRTAPCRSLKLPALAANPPVMHILGTASVWYQIAHWPVWSDYPGCGN